MKTIDIPIHDGERTWMEAVDVEAESGGLVVIERFGNSDGAFSLTHERSGLTVARFQTLRSARAAMCAIDWLMDWSMSGAEIQRELNQHQLGELIRGVLTDFFGIVRSPPPEHMKLSAMREALRR